MAGHWKTGIDQSVAAKWITKTAALLGLAMVALTAPSAQAEPMVEDISGTELMAVLRAEGIDAKPLEGGWAGDPVLEGRYGAYSFVVSTHRCSGEPRRCSLIDFSAGFQPSRPIDLERIDSFNESWVFGKAYLADTGTAYVDFPVNLSDGVSAGNLVDNIRIWKEILPLFEKVVEPAGGS